MLRRFGPTWASSSDGAVRRGRCGTFGLASPLLRHQGAAPAAAAAPGADRRGLLRPPGVAVNHFQSRGGVLLAEGVSTERIAREVGTPTYVYSSATLVRHCRVLQNAFAATPTVVCYSVKACSNLAVLALLSRQGVGFDIVSRGELARVLAAGGDPRLVVFSGVGKTKEELAEALASGILQFNVESSEELEALDAVARSLGRRAPFAIRVNPDVNPRTHRHVATGLGNSKFGVPIGDALQLYGRSEKLPGLLARGLDCHIGSQLTDTRPVRTALVRLASLYRELKQRGFPLTHLDVGGGLGVTYSDERPPKVEDYAAAVRGPLRGLDATLVLEPGRVLVGNAGILLTRVLYRKRAGARRFVVVDAGMNDLIRPALYEAHHDIQPVRPRLGRRSRVDLVGPVCESTDVLGHSRLLPPLERDDLLAVMTAGAYGMTMASNYNSRPRPAEVLVDGKAFRVVRRRESLKDLFRGETP